MRKYLLVPAVLSLALMFVAVETAQAQIRVQIGGSGYNQGRGYNNSGYYNNNWGWGNNYYGNSNYGRGYYGNYNNSPWSYGRYYYPSNSYYVDPAPSYYVDPGPSTSNVAHVRVLLPDPNARVFFNGNPTSQTGTERWFHTPPLTGGVANIYTIRATFLQNGREVTQDRNVAVNPGGTYDVDFSR